MHSQGGSREQVKGLDPCHMHRRSELSSGFLLGLVLALFCLCRAVEEITSRWVISVSVPFKAKIRNNIRVMSSGLGAVA